MTCKAKYAKPSAAGVLMRTAFVLLCLVVLSVYMMGGLLAKYNATDSGRDDARVAKFDVKVTGNAAQNMDITCGSTNNGNYTITVNNNSEVAVRYNISVTVTPTNGKFAANSIGYTLSNDGKGELASGQTQQAHTLSFSVKDWADITKNMSGSTGEVSFTFTVTVQTEQID